MSEKELPPTYEKIRKAREKGQLSVSQDLVALVRLAVVGEIAFLMERSFRQGFEMLLLVAMQSLQPNRQQQVYIVRLWDTIEAATQLATWGVILVLAAAAASLISTLIQTKMNFATKVFAESFQKLSPVANLRQVFSVSKLIMVTLGPLKIGSVLLVIGVDALNAIPIAFQADRLDPSMLWGVSLLIFQSMFRSALIMILFWAVLDIGVQRWLNMRGLRMDHQEVKQEYKDSEGDPHAKSFRKSTGEEVLMSDSKPYKLSVVVVNPEHLAIALAYDYRPDSVPVVIGKGVEELAVYWREFARREGVPIIRYRSLARELYATANVGDSIPRPALAAVALVFQAVLEALKEVQDDSGAIYEIDDEIAAEILRSAPHC